MHLHIWRTSPQQRIYTQLPLQYRLWSCCWQTCLWDKPHHSGTKLVCREGHVYLSTPQLSLLPLLRVLSTIFLLSPFLALGLLLPLFNFTLHRSSLALTPSFPCPLLHPRAAPANGYLFSAAPRQPAANPAARVAQGSPRLRSCPSRSPVPAGLSPGEGSAARESLPGTETQPTKSHKKQLSCQTQILFLKQPTLWSSHTELL